MPSLLKHDPRDLSKKKRIADDLKLDVEKDGLTDFEWAKEVCLSAQRSGWIESLRRW